MSIISKTGLTALAVLCAMAVTPALAANAYLKQTSDAYKKATDSSIVIATLPKGQLVNVLDCTSSYCLVQLPGPDGWVKKTRLGGLSGGQPSGDVPFSFGFSVGGDGKPSISIGIGQQPVIEEDEPEIDEVCFYRNKNFSGASFCVEPGDSDDALSGSWNDSISSIEVSGDAEVLVCRNPDFSGVCSEISSSKATLPSALDNKISSYEVN